MWTLPSSAVELLHSYDYSSILYSTSGGIWLPCDTPADAPAKLATFSAVGLQRAAGKRGQQHLLDAVCYAGGVVWRLEWVPLQHHGHAPDPSAVQQQTEFFAAAVHPKGSEQNKVNQTQAGPGCVQLWGVPAYVDDESPSSKSSTVPHCLYTLVHEGKVAWDIKWLPQPTRAQQQQQQRQQQDGSYDVLGVLAMVLANGTICVTACPEPAQVAAEAGATEAEGSAAASPAADAAPPAVAVQPLFSLNEGVSTGSLPSCCDWLPQLPHNKLLVGCWDGTALCWLLPLQGASFAGGQPPQLLYHVRVDPLALRAVRWAPADTFACEDACPEHMFAAAGHGGRLHIMDPRQQVRPALSRIINRTTWVLDLAWAGRPHTLLMAMEDGELRLMPMAASYLAAAGLQGGQLMYMLRGSSSSTIWSLSHSPATRMIAFCGDDGVVGLQYLEHIQDQRYRRPQAVLGGMQRGADGAVKLSNLPDFLNVPGGTSLVSQGSVYYRQRFPELAEELPASRAFPDEQQCLYSVQFSPNVAGGALWLAYGGAGGFIRMQRLSFKLHGC